MNNNIPKGFYLMVGVMVLIVEGSQLITVASKISESDLIDFGSGSNIWLIMTWKLPNFETLLKIFLKRKLNKRKIKLHTFKIITSFNRLWKHFLTTFIDSIDLQ